MEKNNDFVSGLFAFAPHPKAMDFVKAVLSIKPSEFIAWLEANKGKVNDKGFLPIQILQSQKGGWYAKLNNFQSSPKPETSSAPSAPSEEIDESLIPF